MICEGWYLKKLHGNKYQSGLPDYFALHPAHKLKWIELKIGSNKLSSSQIIEFEKMEKFGEQIYIITNLDQYKVIFEPQGNWREYIRR